VGTQKHATSTGATHRSDLRSAITRDLAALVGLGSPLPPADRAEIAEIYVTIFGDEDRRIRDTRKSGSSRICA
jgi:hypothetical protein